MAESMQNILKIYKRTWKFPANFNKQSSHNGMNWLLELESNSHGHQ